MRIAVIVPAVALAASLTAAATFASDDGLRTDVPREQWMTIAQVAEKLTAEGYDLREIEVEDGGYEIKAVGPDGARIKAYLHPVTGEFLQQKRRD